jgi:hypothetical protein
MYTLNSNLFKNCAAFCTGRRKEEKSVGMSKVLFSQSRKANQIILSKKESKHKLFSKR